MNDQIKIIVEFLNSKPFERGYSAITFHALGQEQLIQLVNDILTEIDSRHAGDIREEAPDARATRILNALKNLKYTPPEGVDISTFRQGIVLGERNTYNPIILYLLQNLENLKTRAYLSRFLVKLQLPPEFVQDFSDTQMQESWTHYEELLAHFKNIHKEYTEFKKQSNGTGEIRKDIKTMEDEKENLTKKVARFQKKVETMPNVGSALEVAQKMRKEKERGEDLRSKIQQQRRQLQVFEQRMQTTRLKLQETRQSGSDANPESIITRMEEDNKLNKYMLEEKLPKEIKQQKRVLRILQQISVEPAMGREDLEKIEDNIDQMNADINRSIEKRMVQNNPSKDKLTLYRQQASILHHKKETLVQDLTLRKDELQALEKEVLEKRQALTQIGGEVLRGEDFKRYVGKLRGKSNTYKQQRQEISDLRSEHGVLSRTEQILKQRCNDSQSNLHMMEAKSGVSGFRATQDDLEKVSSMKSEFDDVKHRTLDDMSDNVNRLTALINDKKGQLAPQIKELRPLRQKHQELTQEWTEKKAEYSGIFAGLESKHAQLEQTVVALREHCTSNESRYYYLKFINEIIEQQLESANNELKSYTASTKQKSLREIYGKKIQEQENRAKTLRDSQKRVRENHDKNQTQREMWDDLNKIIQCKLDCINKGSMND